MLVAAPRSNHMLTTEDTEVTNSNNYDRIFVVAFARALGPALVRGLCDLCVLGGQ